MRICKGVEEGMLIILINWSLSVRFIYVHFFSAAKRNEPKKRRTGDRSEL